MDTAHSRHSFVSILCRYIGDVNHRGVKFLVEAMADLSVTLPFCDPKLP